MKKNKQILLILLSSIVFITSCETEKRLYMPGYYTQWHKQKHKNENSIAVESNKSNVINDKKKDVTIIGNDNQKVNNKEYSYLVSNDNTPVIVSEKPTILKSTIVESKLISSPSNSTKQVKNNSSKVLQSTKNNKKTASDSEGGGGGTKTLGFIFLLSGFVVLLFVSILLGLLIMVPGIIFLATSKRRTKSDNTPSKSKDESNYIDVVYLKNGSVIKGMIVEQTPGVSLKIQSRDGNIFVYKMEEVERMTKELSK
jgi:hypothetical protein